MAVAGLCALFANYSPVIAADKPIKSPEVMYTGKTLTGYTLTFRYANPAAKTVKIKGEWSFSRPSELPQLAATLDNPVIEGQGLLPKDWQPGDFPLQRPISAGPNFPITDMTTDKNGVWTYTTPLPSGDQPVDFHTNCCLG